MTLAQRIIDQLESLPESRQAEVLDFVELLASREEDRAWSAFSLSQALRGLEDEPEPYTLADLRETSR